MDNPSGTAGTSLPPPDIEALVAVLKSRVEERRSSGHYPAGLEEKLDAHFRRIAAHRAEAPDLRELEIRLGQLRQFKQFGVDRIPESSGMPAGQAVHRAVAKLVSRQVGGALHQVAEFADVLTDLLEAMVRLLSDPRSHVHSDLVGQIDAAVERLADEEMLEPDSTRLVADLRRRIEALEAAESSRQFKPWFTNDRFEDEFRGESAELASRYVDLAALFTEGPVLDLGCGRGEFLELLAANDVVGWGVEMDPALVDEGISRGLDVRHGDGVAVLAAETDASLGGLALIQVVEHLPPQRVLDLVALAAAKVRPGGKVVIETVNPQSLYVYAHSFYLDPTHSNPVHPAYLAFLFREIGFPSVEIEWRSPPPEGDRLVSEGGGVTGDNVERLNRLLFAPQDYALIATR